MGKNEKDEKKKDSNPDFPQSSDCVNPGLYSGNSWIADFGLRIFLLFSIHVLSGNHDAQV
jgi:hypothetical protein